MQICPKRRFSQNFRGAFGVAGDFNLFFTFIAFSPNFLENGSIKETPKSKYGSWSPPWGHPPPIERSAVNLFTALRAIDHSSQIVTIPN